MIVDDVGDLFQAPLIELYRWRVAWVDAEKDLDRGVFKLFEFGVRILPAREAVAPRRPSSNVPFPAVD